jgi:serine phosphatase RsbU (regulator of sigma subunit)
MTSFSPRTRSRLPFPPAIVCAITSSLGIFLVVLIHSLVVPDIGLLEMFPRQDFKGTAESFMARHNGARTIQGKTELRTVSVNGVVAKDLRKRYGSKETTELITQKQFPVVAAYVYWLRSNGALAAQVGVSPLGDIVSYLNADVPVVPLGPDALSDEGQARSVTAAKAFLSSGTGVNAAGYGTPTVGRVPSTKAENREEIEVLWRRPAPGLTGMAEVLTVRLRGGVVWFYQHRLEPESRVAVLPLVFEQIIPLFLSIPNFLLVCFAGYYLVGVYRRQQLYWRPPFVVVVIFLILMGLQSVNTVPFAISKSLFQSGGMLAQPDALTRLTSFGQILASLIMVLIVTLFMMAAGSVGLAVGFGSILHLETENRRWYTETFRGVLALKHLPYNRFIKASLTGGGVGWTLLGVAGVVRYFQGAPSVYGDETNIQALLDSLSPNVFVIAAVFRAILQDGILLFCFTWVMLNDRFRIPVRYSLPIMTIWGSLGWTSLTGILFLETMYTPWTLATNAVITVVLIGLLERHGLWSVLFAIWSFQFTEAILLGASIPSLGISPWLMTFMLVLPSVAILLCFKKPTPELEARLAPTLLDRFVEEQRYEQQLAIAARIQSDFLPKTIPSFSGWELAVRSLPAREVGGDFYDFIQLEGGRTGIFVGDISGKSVPGALFMAVATTTFHSEAEECDAGCAPLLERLNQLLYADMKRVRMFAAATYALFNPVTGDLTLSNAALPAPLLYRASEDRAEYLDLNGLPLGSMRISRYSEGEVTMESGDILVLSSDGVVEALDEEDRMFGYERLSNLVTENADATAEELTDLIFEAVREHAGDAEQSDDITVLVLKKS